MMSNEISNLMVFEIFASDHEYLRFCVYRILMRFIGSKLEVHAILVAPLFPSEAYYLWRFLVPAINGKNGAMESAQIPGSWNPW